MLIMKRLSPFLICICFAVLVSAQDKTPFYAAKVMKDGKYGLVNQSGKLFVPVQYDNIDVYTEGMAMVQKDNMSGFVNQSGQLVVPMQYEEAYNYFEGIACVRKDGKYGFIDKKGELVVPAQF